MTSTKTLYEIGEAPPVGEVPARMTSLTTMLPGAADALEALQDAGLRLAIVSQKLRYRVEDVLRREGLLECFLTILGGEDVPAFKPDPRGILMKDPRARL